MLKKIALGLVLLLLTTVFLAACRAATPLSKEIDCASSDIQCVGLVTGLGGVNDHSYNQMAWEGVQKAQAEKAADRVQYIETVDAKDYSTNITTLAQAGYDVIVTVGSLQADATSSAANNYPRILFIGVDQPQGADLPNLVRLVFRPDQAGFQAGALAALMTRTNTIAAVLGPDTVPDVVVLKEGFEAGAHHINPAIKVISTYFTDGSEMIPSDPRWAAGIASQSILSGADIVFDAGGMTGHGALMETASYVGAFCIGVDGDLWDIVPESRPCLISSTVNYVAQGVTDLVKLARDGSFPSSEYFGTTGLASYHDFEAAVPQAVRDELSRISAGLVDGSIVTGYSPGK